MDSNLPTPPELTANGWQFYEMCRCSGVLKYKYRNTSLKGYEVEWWPRVYRFKVTHDNKTIRALEKMPKLDETLKGL